MGLQSEKHTGPSKNAFLSLETTVSLVSTYVWQHCLPEKPLQNPSKVSLPFFGHVFVGILPREAQTVRTINIEFEMAENERHNLFCICAHVHQFFVATSCI